MDKGTDGCYNENRIDLQKVGTCMGRELPALSTELIAQGLEDNRFDLNALLHQVKLPSLASCLNEFLGRQRINTDVMAELAGMNRASAYKILNGEMKPSRNVLLRIALVLELSFEECQILLKCGERAALSASRPRDLVLMDAVINRHSIDDVNQQLQQNKFLDLYSRG